MNVKDSRSVKPQKLSEAERARLARLDSPLIDWLAAWTNKSLTCAHCKGCTRRCEVLEQSALDIGLVEADFQRIKGLAPEGQPAAVMQLAQERPELYHALRRCCFCGFCTSLCETHMLAPERMREWRALFMQAGLMPPDDSKLVMVDNEWHIFSAYRAIYGIGYPEFIRLEDAAAEGPGMVDTLFFPGCSLVSYAPELMRKVGQWLTCTGFAWAMSDACCGSPLMSAGLFERSEALRRKLLDQIRASGITRVITVCPGCGEELGEVMGDEVDITPLPELLWGTLPKESAHVGEGAFRADEDGTGAGMEGTAAFPVAPRVPSSITFFDSCHDRFDKRHGKAIRRLMKSRYPQIKQFEMRYRGKHTLCCGAGGAVAAYDSDITQKRVWRVIDEARATKADMLITTCPTCTYTIAQACLGADATRGIDSHHYLELIFGQAIDWKAVFGQLESMWTGEYGPWLAEVFF